MVLGSVVLFSRLLAPSAGAAAPAQELFTEETAVVASLSPEPLAEAPVITTVITAAQIRRMGARTLNEVLLTVPGFSRIQDHNEYFSALRGIYGSSQQKLLVLRDGHRLNSRSYSQANFGPGLSLANVRRIEVMRGPASALYGDVATSGVINIVTKEGAELGGGRLTAGGGSHGQGKLDFVYGRDLGGGRDIAVHAGVYQTGGERRSVDAAADYAPSPAGGTVLIDRFKGAWPGHDVGLKYRVNDLSFAVSRRYEHYAHPRGSAGGYGQLIEHGAYRAVDGTPLGASFETNHAEVKYAPLLGETVLTARPYFDTLATAAVEPSRRAGEPGAAAGSPRSSVIQWKDYSYGLDIHALRPYDSSGGRSTMLAGVQVEQVRVYGSSNLLSPDAGSALWRLSDAEALPSARETTYAVFGQLKHRFLESLLVNAGLRYDYKARALYSQTVDRVSPRAALIAKPWESLSLRLGFGRSFADPPYFYRYNTLGAAGYQGSDQLRPETLDSTQLSAEWKGPWRLTQRVNLFANDYRDVFFRDVDGLYKNTGLVRTRGAELELETRRDGLWARASYTFLYAEPGAAGYQVKDHKLSDVPAHIGNLSVDYAPLRAGDGWRRGLWLHGALRAVGEQFAPIGVSQPAGTADFAGRDLTHVEPARAVGNLGLSLEDVLEDVLGKDSLTFRVHVYNVLDARYRQGGSVNLPYEQPGRWFLLQLSYQWF